jgi:hypothetical protein
VALGALLRGAPVAGTGTWCSRCDEQVTVDGATGDAVHTVTQLEMCADGRAVKVTATDPAKRDEANAIEADFQGRCAGLSVGWFYGHFRADTGRPTLPLQADTGEEMRSRLSAFCGGLG